MQYFFDVITERKNPSAFVKGGLAALSYLFRAGVQLRNLAYARKWIKPIKLHVPVISVGNIAVGGTGKTPFVHMLAHALQESAKLAILSRGFRSQIESSGESVKVGQAGKPFYSPEQCGDEPYLLAQETLADVWVGRDRVASGYKAIEAGAECLILDDGFQHRRLARDIELVLIDAKDPFSQRKFLPRGLLRDLPSRLKEADLIIANSVADREHAAALHMQLKQYTDAPLLGIRVEAMEVEHFHGKRVGVFCGIGSPKRFIQMLSAENVSIADNLLLTDHRAPDLQLLARFAKECQKKGADRLLCTMKDWVKLPQDLKCCLPVFPVKMRFDISFGAEHWSALINQISSQIAKNRAIR